MRIYAEKEFDARLQLTEYINRLFTKLHSQKKFRGPVTDAHCVRASALHWSDVGRLLALRALANFKRNLLLLFQSFEALYLNLRKMSEQVLAAAIWRDEPKALGVIEPLYRTSLHLLSRP
jgi:hypothetical protein